MAITTALTDSWETKSLQWLMTTTAAASIDAGASDTQATSALYLALCTSSPGESGAMNTAEMTAGDATNGYARQTVTNLMGIASRIAKLSADVVFPAATGNWSATVTHWAICASSTRGTNDALIYGDLIQTQTILSTDVFTFTSAAHEIKFVVSGNCYSNVAQDLILAWLFNASTAISNPTRPTAWYRSLYTSDPTVAESGTEVGAGVGYSRGATTFTVSGDIATPSADVSIGPATGAGMGTVTHTGVHSASTGTSKMLCFAALGTSKTIGAGQTATIKATSTFSIG